ncbi:base non-specific acid ribonuclease [Pluteus cervinus]|uniref:Base non-specific acid ribonuclease n=1 Tax=Pluteus cervinus TaxID=181527 RepID=A0ACD3BHM4_9AGAR|nr:base non-specific acid ribonuclease [Pluteus cervinus]
MAPSVPCIVLIAVQAVLAKVLMASRFLPNANLECINSELLSCGDLALDSANSCCVESPGGELVHPQIWDSQPPRGPLDSWTIHGLWPNFCGGHGFPSNCDRSRDYTNVAEILKENGASNLLSFMDKFWVNLNGRNEEFWEHEWAKHGTCMSTLQPSCRDGNHPRGFEAVIYFQTAVKLFESFPTYQWLASAGITPSSHRAYRREEILSALSSASGVTPSLECKGKVFSGVSWYFNLKGPIAGADFVPLSASSLGSCPAVGIEYLPKN